MAALPSGAVIRPSRRRYNMRLVRREFSYTIHEIAELFGLHPNAIRRWLKDGLPTIDDRKPYLVHGSDLAQYLEEKQRRRKRPCAPGEMYCCRCRTPRRPAGGRVRLDRLNARQFMLRGECGVCGARMNRGGSLVRQSDICRAFTIATASTHLDETTDPVVMCDLSQGADDVAVQSEK